MVIETHFQRGVWMENKIGSYSFIMGVIITIVLGLAATLLGDAATWLWPLLVILGMLVGYSNISSKDAKDFLWVTAALVLISFAGSQENSWVNIQPIGPYLKSIFDSILVFIVPASIVAALREIWVMARE